MNEEQLRAHTEINERYGLEVEKLPERLDAEIGAHDGTFNRFDIEPVSYRKVRVRSSVTVGLLLAALTVFAYGISLYWVIYFVGLILS